MFKTLLLFGKPKDKVTFDEHFRKINLPLIVQIPKVEDVMINRIAGSAVGESTLHMIVELHFSSEEALQRGLNSKIGQMMGADFKNFATGGVTILFCQSDKATDNINLN